MSPKRPSNPSISPQPRARYGKRGMLPAAAAVCGFVVLAGLAATVLIPRAGRSNNGVGGPFTLTAPDGRTVTQAVLEGHPTLVFFGYTHCPDTCPATLSEMSAVFKRLPAEDKARALFITVDPERDTPTVMKDYMSSFDPHIIGLTGSPAAIRSVEAAYKAYAKAVPDADGTYTMDHTAITYLMDKTGTFVGAFNLDRPAQEAAAELKSYQ